MCLSKHTQPWKSPLQPVSSKPLFTKLLLSNVSTRIHQRAQQGKGFPPKIPPSVEGCLEDQGTFPHAAHLFQRIFTEVPQVRKHCPDLTAVEPGLLASLVGRTVGHHSPSSGMPAVLSSLQHSQSQVGPSRLHHRTQLPPTPCTGAGQTLIRGLRSSSVPFSILFPKLCPQACGGMAYLCTLVTGLGSCD